MYITVLLKSGRRSCCPASLRLVSGLPDPNLPSCSKMPMSLFSPKCQMMMMPFICSYRNKNEKPPRQTTNVNPFAKMHNPRAPHSFSVSLSPCRPHSNCPTLGILRPLYLLRFSVTPLSRALREIRAKNCILRVQQLIDPTIPDPISL